MGRPRQSNAVKEANGTQPCRMNKGEVAAPLGLGEPPERLDGPAKDLWNRIIAEAPPNVLTVADRLVIEQMVLLAAELEECRITIEEEGRQITETRGSGKNTYSVTKAHPLLPTLHNTRKQFFELANRFGFTASARAALSAESPKPPSPLVAFLEKARAAADAEDQAD